MQDLLVNLLVEYSQARNARQQVSESLVRSWMTAHSVHALSAGQQSELLFETLDRPQNSSFFSTFLQTVRRVLLSDGLAVVPDVLVRLLNQPDHRPVDYWSEIIELAARASEQTIHHPEVVASLKAARANFDRFSSHSNCHALSIRITSILKDRRFPMLAVIDPWAEVVESQLSALTLKGQSGWQAILDHAQDLSSAKPSSKWTKTAVKLIEDVGIDTFCSMVLIWFPLVAQPRTQGEAHFAWQLADRNCDLLKGLVWSLSSCPGDLVRPIGALAMTTGRRIPGTGPRSLKVMNACIHVLGKAATPDALGQLALLKSRLKMASAQKEIEKALLAVASKLNVSRDELEEMGVPIYGLTDIGRLEEPLGDFTAELTVADSGKTVITWRKPDGKLQKSVPASVKTAHAEELKDLKAAAKDIEKMLPAQRERLDNLFLHEKRWPVDVWRERYLDHPLVGILARRLIWSFKNTGLETTGIWLGDAVVNVDDDPIDWIDAEGTTVELWHPIGRPLDDVLSWRHWLERHEIRQPFKQAHREVYVLTDAERRTRTYSNRYAAHVIRQHQFNALCAARAWKNQLRLMVDASYSPPTKVLQQWGLRAEFWVESIGDDYGTDTTDSGTYLYLTTDQVRFYRLEAAEHSTHSFGGGYVTEGVQAEVNEPLPLEVIPPIVLSEIMRDVDLFVGVASVGNDPTWSDGGPDGRYRDYWQSFSFGDLTPSAQTRKQVLERLVSRLKIGPRCSFSEKFLVVRGDLLSYKIHLGSGNILMEPNDQYLCIVPDSSAVAKGDSVFLPFEGDRTLSIILSKAMLLADDRAIKDPTIVRQILNA